MGLLGLIVQVLRAAVLDRGHDLAVRDGVAGQLIGHDHPGQLAQSLQELAEELRGGLRVSTRLDQDVEHGAVLVHRPAQVPQPAVDPCEHLVEMPFVPGPGRRLRSLAA